LTGATRQDSGVLADNLTEVGQSREPVRGRIMSLKREIHYPSKPAVRRAVVHVNELIKEIELITGIRKRIREHYYERPDVLVEIGERIRERLKSK
jgi:hypothetical protein